MNRNLSQDNQISMLPQLSNEKSARKLEQSPGMSEKIDNGSSVVPLPMINLEKSPSPSEYKTNLNSEAKLLIKNLPKQ